ncbi:MAG: hypothetical protein FJ319_10870 [SAR202 cluster bacterium]|nr:hypothetical protein [SAR202 cluster bacterium]
MSKLIEKLSKVGQGQVQAMGFASSSRKSEANPHMLLIGKITPDAAADPGLAGARVDAFLLALDAWDEQAVTGIAGKLEDRVWGIRMSAVTSQQAKKVGDFGGDFIVFDADPTESSVLDEEKLGKFVTITDDMDDDVGRIVNALPIDGAYFSSNEDLQAMTVGKLINIGLVSGVLSGPVLMPVPGDLSTKDLEGLRSVGVAGVVVDLASSSDVAEIKAAIAEMSAKRPAKRKGRNALVPSLASAAAAPSPRRREGEDDGEDEHEGH